MDKRPKRIKDKYNPYTLESEKEKNMYRVSFIENSKKINIEISRKVFEELEEVEKEDVRLIQSNKRHIEQSLLTEISLNARAINKNINTEDKAISNIYYEQLHKAVNKLPKTERRRILLYYQYNFTMEKIAKIEGCSKVAIKYSLDIALKKLKKYLNKI